MRLFALALLPATALASTQVYLSPAAPGNGPASVSNEQAQGLVAHQLSLSRFAQPALSWASEAFQSILNAEKPFEHGASRDSCLVLYQGPQEVIPDQLRPVLRVDDEESSLQDWEEYLSDLLQQSASWFESGLGHLWREAVARAFGQVPSDITLPVEPEETHSRFLTQFDFANANAKPLLRDLEEMSNLVDQAKSTTTSWALRLTGLAEFEASKPSSEQLQQARALYKQMLEATLAAFRARTSASSKITFIASEPSDASAHKKRQPSLRRRQTQVLASAARNVTPVVPVSKQCYSSYESCMENTGGCSSHGACVTAIQGGSSCFACSCSKVNGTAWAGEMCEKQQVASSFWLLVGSTLLLVVTVGVSVGLLSSAGSEELPQVLSQ